MLIRYSILKSTARYGRPKEEKRGLPASLSLQTALAIQLGTAFKLGINCFTGHCNIKLSAYLFRNTGQYTQIFLLQRDVQVNDKSIAQ